jgi:large subunit ribosomal protein L19
VPSNRPAFSLSFTVPSIILGTMSQPTLSRVLARASNLFNSVRIAPSPIASSSKRTLVTAKGEVPTESQFCSTGKAAERLANDSVALSSPSPYPFSSSATFPTSPFSSTSPPPASLLSPRKGFSVVEHVNASLLQTYDPLNLCRTLFSRRHPDRLTTGSVLTVISHSSPARTSITPFSGVLMGIRRRGVDTSFTLRNVVSKTGVEMSFKVCSPMIKEIKIVKRADGSKGGLRNLKRARVNYLRDRPQVMAQIASALKAARA